MPFTQPEWDWSAAYKVAETAGDERPTWAYDWPAGQRLAADLTHFSLPDRVADLGCGRGLLGLTALQHGCREVLFADASAVVLEYVQEVLKLNNFDAEVAVHKWGEPLPGGQWPCILGGDILYRPECFKDLMYSLAQSLTEDGYAYLSDPRRQCEPELQELAADNGLILTVDRPGDRYSLLMLRKKAKPD